MWKRKACSQATITAGLLHNDETDSRLMGVRENEGHKNCENTGKILKKFHV